MLKYFRFWITNWIITLKHKLSYFLYMLLVTYTNSANTWSGERKYIFTQTLWSSRGLCDFALLLPFCDSMAGGGEETPGFLTGPFVPLRCLWRFVLLLVSRFLWRLWACSSNQSLSQRGPGLSGVVGLYDTSPVHLSLHGLLCSKCCSSFFFFFPPLTFSFQFWTSVSVLFCFSLFL